MTPARPGSLTAITALVLTGLYFAQGLPFGFFTQAVPVMLRRAGFGLVEISAAGVLFAPWALKFLWAPYVDRYGTRKRWLVALQLVTAATALVLATLDYSDTLTWLFVGIAVINVASATQDVATDGLAVRLLDERGRGLGNGIQVGAYRIGMIVGGGGLLLLYGVAGWRALFVAMAVLLLLATLPVCLLREPPAGREHTTGALALTGTWITRLRRPGVPAFLGLLVAFKFGDSMTSALVGPYLVDSGCTITEISWVKGGLASAGALAGAAAGGVLTARMGRRRALLVTGIAQTASLGLYLVSALGVGGFALVVAATLAEHVLGGAATVALFALMMDACEAAHAGTDYTLYACAVVLAQGAAGLAGGVIGDLAGYPALFGTGLVLSGLGCAVLVLGLRRGLGPT
ncbi:MAG: MFS transporter [Gordonia sp. (in: high G+C Gram-positive bacteria)]